MEDLHSFHTRNYDKSADLEDVSILQHIFGLSKALPRFLVKILFVLIAEIYYSLVAPIYHCFVPLELADISGQLAAVSEKYSIFTIDFAFQKKSTISQHHVTWLMV